MKTDKLWNVGKTGFVYAKEVQGIELRDFEAWGYDVIALLTGGGEFELDYADCETLEKAKQKVLEWEKKLDEIILQVPCPDEEIWPK